MADKPVLKIPVDTSEWDEFVKQFNQYQEILAKQPESWKAANTAAGTLAGTFNAAANSFNKIVSGAQQAQSAFSNAATSAQQTAAASGQAASNVGGTQAQKGINNFAAKSASSANSWKNLVASMTIGNRAMAKISSMSVAAGAFKLGKAGIQGLTAGFATYALAENNLANMAKNARRLGLKPGEEQAFNDVYGPAGGSSQMLENVAQAKTDPQQWRFMQALGVTPEEIQNKDAAALSQEVLQKAGQMFNKIGPSQYGMWSQAMGVDNLLSPNDARLASTFENKGAFPGLNDQFQSVLKQTQVSEAAADAATKFKQELDAATDSLKNNFEAHLANLAPQMIDVLKAITDLGIAIVDSPITKGVLTDFGNAIEKIAKWINNDFKIDTGKITHDPNGPMLPNQNGKPWTLGGWWHDLTHGGSKPPAVAGDGTVPTKIGDFTGGGDGQLIPVKNRDAYFAALEQAQGLPPGTLAGVEGIESKNGKFNTGPMTKFGWKAQGPFQFSPDNIKKYNINPMDEKMQAAAAAIELQRLSKKYNGDQAKIIAAYNWGEGNVDKDLNKHGGDWLNYTPAETQKYIKGMANAVPGTPNVPNNPTTVMDDQSQDTNGFSNRMMDAAQAFRDAVTNFGSIFREGGGSSLRSKDTGPSTPQTINVTVTAPAGSNTHVTSGSLPQ